MSNAYVDPWNMLNNFCFHVYFQKVPYPKIPNKGRTSNKMCAPLFWRNKMNWKIMGAHQIKSARELFIFFNLPKIITSIISIIEQKVRQFWKAQVPSFSKWSLFLFYDKNYGSYGFYHTPQKMNWKIMGAHQIKSAQGKIIFDLE